MKSTNPALTEMLNKSFNTLYDYRTPIACLHCPTYKYNPGSIWYLKGDGKGNVSCKFCQDLGVEPIPWSELK